GVLDPEFFGEVAYVRFNVQAEKERHIEVVAPFAALSFKNGVALLREQQGERTTAYVLPHIPPGKEPRLGLVFIALWFGIQLDKDALFLMARETVFEEQPGKAHTTAEGRQSSQFSTYLIALTF